MNTFDRHLLREWLRILALVVVATTGLMFAQILYDDFQHLREMGARGLDLWVPMLVELPSFLAFVLPLAMLVSLLYVLGQLHRANEFLALRAAGVSLIRITRPVWLIGVLACGLMWWLNSTVVPWSVEEAHTLDEAIQFRHEQKEEPEDRVGLVGSVAFDNYEARRLWFFNSYSRVLNRGYGVMVSELDASRRERSRLQAREAVPLPDGGWDFREGNIATFDPETGEVLSTTSFDDLRKPEFDEDPALMLLIDRRVVDLSFHELRRLLEYYRSGNNPKGTTYAVRYFGLVADTLSPLIIIGMSIPFAVSGVRVNPAVGVSKSIGLFFLYYVLINFAPSLAIKGVLSPEVAAWMPNVCLSGLAIWFLARLR